MIVVSAPAKRNTQPRANDSEWVELQDHLESSPPSVWAPDYSDYEEEITLQSKRVAATPLEKVKAGAGDEANAGEANPRVLTLDESQVLPSEASFATVQLHQQFDPTAVNEREHLTTRVEGSTVNRATSRTRTLDVAHVLPGEVSYATVILQTSARTYSPLREFFSKSSWDWRKLTVEALLLVLISSTIAIVGFKIARPGVFSSHQTESTSANTFLPQAEPTAAQSELPTSQPVVLEAISSPETEVKDKEPPASAPQTDAKLETTIEVAQDKFAVALNPEGSRKAAADEIKSKPRRIPQREAESRTGSSVSAVESTKRELTNQVRRESVKEAEGSHRAAPPQTVGVNNSRTVGTRQESSLSTNAPATRPKDAPTTTPVTGGGQRPRTVKPKVNP